MRPLALTLAAVLLGASARADCPLPIAEEAVVARIHNGVSFDLADGGRVRLAAIQSPGGQTAVEARAALSSLVLGKRVELALDERSVDRHGDIVAHVFVGKRWLQAHLIDSGLARVHTHKDIRACAKPLLAREADARAAKRGLWAHAVHRLRGADELAGDIGTFQIIEGTPLAIVTRRDRTYVNFGPDYRTDFTATIARRDLKRFTQAGIDPVTWRSKKIRVRGWLSLLNGPEIELTHPEQVEIAD